MIKPTVGRVVWFWPSAAASTGDIFCYHDRKQPCAALIAHVWGDTCVNLHVFDQNGVGHNFTSVPLHQEGGPRPDGYFCEWMPYQIGQAKRHEGAAPPPKPVADGASDQTIEQEIQAKGLTAAPRVTLADIETAIRGEHYEVIGTLTLCVLTLRNGFTVTGESACVSQANFNAEIGRKIARQKAVDKVWPLEGYLLASRLSSVEQIARVAHEVNRAYCQALGDNSQPSWEGAPEWQWASAINGVKFHFSNPDAGPDHSHNAWLAEKEAAGWKYGPVKDPERREHPCFVPYEQLPVEQKAKDYLFRAVVHALR